MERNFKKCVEMESKVNSTQLCNGGIAELIKGVV